MGPDSPTESSSVATLHKMDPLSPHVPREGYTPCIRKHARPSDSPTHNGSRTARYSVLARITRPALAASSWAAGRRHYNIRTVPTAMRRKGKRRHRY